MNALVERLLSRKGPLVKTCGMSRSADIEAVNLARPDLCGFIVGFPKSRRNVSVDRLVELAGMVASGIVKVAVFVDAEPQAVADACVIAGIDMIQLHGSEDEVYLSRLRSLVGIPIMQAFRLQSLVDVGRARQSGADLLLLDAGQGSGETFEWSLAAGVDRPYLLAGGIGIDNIARAYGQLHPAGFDMSSSLETDGVKDPAKIAAAVKAVRALGAARAMA